MSKSGPDATLTWVDTSGAVSPVHNVWRATLPDMSDAAKLDTTNQSTTTDPDIPLPGQCFFYQVENVIE